MKNIQSRRACWCNNCTLTGQVLWKTIGKQQHYLFRNTAPNNTEQLAAIFLPSERVHMRRANSIRTALGASWNSFSLSAHDFKITLPAALQRGNKRNKKTHELSSKLIFTIHFSWNNIATRWFVALTNKTVFMCTFLAKKSVT